MTIAISEARICTMALSHLGQSIPISNLTTDVHAYAQIARFWYDTARDDTLRSFFWPFARAYKALGLVEADPFTALGYSDWAYSYRVPDNSIRVRRILSGFRNETQAQRVPYNLGQDDQGNLIYTDLANAVLEFTKKITDVTRFPPDFVLALSYRMGQLMAPAVTNGDPKNMGDKCFKLFLNAVAMAKSSAINEEQADLPVESDFIRARD